MCYTALHFRANSKHLNPPLQTHLPPQSTTSHTNSSTHTHTSATQPPRPGADLICWVQPESSALHLSFIHMMSHRAAAFFCEPGAGKLFVRWGWGSCHKRHRCPERQWCRCRASCQFKLHFHFVFMQNWPFDSSTAQTTTCSTRTAASSSHFASPRAGLRFFVSTWIFAPTSYAVMPPTNFATYSFWPHQ